MPLATRTLFVAIHVLLAAVAAPAGAQSAMPDPGMMFDGSTAVARLSDAEASCEQLFAEATHLERTVAAMPRPEDPATLAMKMQADMREAQQKMVAGQRARSIGTSLLSLVPGAGMVAGAVSSLGSRGAGTAALDKTIETSMRAQQDSMAAMMAVSRLQARQGYVTQLFVERGCKPSQLDAAALAAATAALAGQATDAIDPPLAVAQSDDVGSAASVGARAYAIVAPPEAASETVQAPSVPTNADEDEAAKAPGADDAPDTSGPGDA